MKNEPKVKQFWAKTLHIVIAVVAFTLVMLGTEALLYRIGLEGSRV
jgi:hypothetical protein